MPDLSLWTYAALVGVLAVSSAGPPLPATLSLTLAAVAARQGHHSLTLLVVVATLATLAGDLAGYAAGRLLGHSLGGGSWAARLRSHRLSRRVGAAIAWLDARGGAGGP